MTGWRLFALSAVALFAVGLYGLFSSQQLVRRILAANVAGSAVMLLLVALARRVPTGSPDPVPHALVLTGIVVSVSATGVALALARRLSQRPPGEGRPR